MVREDLLIRTDLAPGLVESLPTREIAELEAQRARLDAQRMQAEQTLGACEQARRQADTAATLANAGLAQLGTRLESARAERAAAQRLVDQELKEAAQRARQQLTELERADAELQAEKKAQEEGHQAAIKARERRQADDASASPALFAAVELGTRAHKPGQLPTRVMLRGARPLSARSSCGRSGRSRESSLDGASSTTTAMGKVARFC